MTERNNYYFNYGQTICVFSGAKYIYEKIGRVAGIKKVGDRNYDREAKQGSIQDSPEKVKRMAVKLVAVCDGVVGVATNTQQADRKVRVSFLCDPEKAEDAMRELVGVTLDRGAGFGRLKITKVYRPLRRLYY